MKLKDVVKTMAAENLSKVINIRRHLHQHPELSFQEHETSAYICRHLDELGISYRKGFARHGIVAKIQGINPDKKVIALRADMDALPIEESNNMPFKSVNEGVMHACGHDVHSASLLGTAMILNQLKSHFTGTVLLIFQPGEERFPGGASLMMAEGALNDPEPELIIGQHVLPEMAAGHVCFREGICMASGDEIHLTITGKGGHAALPHMFTDNVLIASQIVVSLQQVVSRFVPAQIPTVLSFGRFIAPGSTNVMPEKVELSGTLRTMNDEWRQKIKEKIKEIAITTANAMGAECNIVIHDGYPMVKSDPSLTHKLRKAAETFLGPGHVHEMDMRMTAEDFGYYTQKYPCTFYRFGVKQNDDLETGTLHTPHLNINEKALETSMGTMAWLAISALNGD